MRNKVKILILISIIVVTSSFIIPSINSGKINSSADNSLPSTIFYPANVRTHQISVENKAVCPQSPKLLLGKDSNNQTHPSISSNQYGSHMISYVTDVDDRIYFGTIDGPTVYWDFSGGDYPSVKHWQNTIYYATVVPNASVYNGGVIYLISTTDPLNTNSYWLLAQYWPSNYGWYHIKDSEIVCDSSMESWNFGFISLIASNDNYNLMDAPHHYYRLSENVQNISWVSNRNNSLHTDACIDYLTKKTYSIYDRIDNNSWQLFLRVSNFSKYMEDIGMYDIIGTGNLTTPKISVNNEHMIIVTETDQNNNKDILCLYGSPTNHQESFIADSPLDEQFPDVEHVVDDIYICTFSCNNKIYYSITSNAGMTWTRPIEFKKSVIEEYKTIDLSEGFDYIGYETMNATNTDVIFENEEKLVIFVDDDFDATTPGWSITHFNTLQDGIDAVNENGTVIVHNGIYNENIIIDKTINLIGEEKNNSIIIVNATNDGDGISIFSQNSSLFNLTIINGAYRNTPIVNQKYNPLYSKQRSGPGNIILIDENSNNTFINQCEILGQNAAFFSIQSDTNHISNCSFINVSEIHVYHGSRSIIENNTFVNDTIGLIISDSPYNLIKNNSFKNCGMLISGPSLNSFDQEISNNIVNGKPLIYLKNQDNFSYTAENLGQLILVNCSRITISDITLCDTSCGIELAHSQQITMQGNELNNNIIGIVNIESNNNSISQNTITYNMDGIYFILNCKYTSIIQNNINQNTFGIEIDRSQDIIIKNNILASNYMGAYVYYSNNNTIVENNILDCNHGIRLDSYTNNTVYHNNFLENIQNAEDYTNNIWDNGSVSGGNYWDNYTGIDNDNNGIGDTPYNISDGNNIDRYPLIHAYGLISELSIGWSFSSLPTNISTNVSDIIVLYNGVFYTFQEAVDQGIISPFLFGWDRFSQSYNFMDELHPGYGYWIYAYKDCSLWTFNYERNIDDYISTPEPKWNVIGIQFDFPIIKYDILVNNYTWTEAVNMGIISDFIFGWNSMTQSYTFINTFEPGEACWILANLNCVLKRNI